LVEIWVWNRSGRSQPAPPTWPAGPPNGGATADRRHWAIGTEAGAVRGREREAGRPPGKRWSHVIQLRMSQGRWRCGTGREAALRKKQRVRFRRRAAAVGRAGWPKLYAKDKTRREAGR